MGCALVVTEGGSYAELPDEACIKISAKQDPSNELAELIRSAAQDPTMLAGIRAAALQYARSALDPTRIARRYSEIAHA
jgi:glycosyltransferase involved in cell wall biosynthesis